MLFSNDRVLLLRLIWEVKHVRRFVGSHDTEVISAEQNRRNCDINLISK